MLLILWCVILAFFIFYRVNLAIIVQQASLLLTAIIRAYDYFKGLTKYIITMAIWVIALVIHIATNTHWLAAVVDVLALILLTIEFLNQRRHKE